jgi:ribosome-interacting GTPase 1
MANLGMDALLSRMWDAMDLRRLYTKKTGCKPDFAEPVMLSVARGGSSVGAFCKQLHADLAKQLAYALVWGVSAKHYPQRCGTSHELCDEDVVQLVKKKNAELGGAARGRFKTTTNEPARIGDREKKKALRS